MNSFSGLYSTKMTDFHRSQLPPSVANSLTQQARAASRPAVLSNNFGQQVLFSSPNLRTQQSNPSQVTLLGDLRQPYPQVTVFQPSQPNALFVTTTSTPATTWQATPTALSFMPQSPGSFNAFNPRFNPQPSVRVLQGFQQPGFASQFGAVNASSSHQNTMRMQRAVPAQNFLQQPSFRMPQGVPQPGVAPQFGATNASSSYQNRMPVQQSQPSAQENLMTTITGLLIEMLNSIIQSSN